MKTTRTSFATSVLPLLALAVKSAGQPVITTEPTDQLAIPGQQITLRVQVLALSGSAPVMYQWSKDDLALAAKTNTTLVFTNIQPADAGSYSVLVSDPSGSTKSRTVQVTVIGPVALDPKLGANIQLGADPVELPLGRRAQAEPHLVRSFTDPGYLLMTVQEGRFESGGGAAAIGYAVSRDGGPTWTRGILPGISTVTGGSFARASDPVGAIDLEGNIFVSSIGLPSGSPPKAVLVSVSTNHGLTFNAPVLIERATSSDSVDKEWLAVNTFAGSPTANRVAVVYTFIRSTNEFHLSYSDDRGQTWSRPQTIATGALLFIGQASFLPDGSLVLLYSRYLAPLRATVDLAAPVQLEYLRAADGGTNFAPATVIADLTGKLHHDSVARDAYDLCAGCTDRQAGVVYVT